VLALTAAMAFAPGHAQQFPTKEVHIIPYATRVGNGDFGQMRAQMPCWRLAKRRGRLACASRSHTGRYANAAAALSTTGFGAVAPLPQTQRARP